MLPNQKKEKKSVDSLKRTCTLKKKEIPPSPFREPPTFLNPDIFYCTLQRACLIFLTFHGFHLLCQIDRGPLYPLEEISVDTGLIQS